MTAIIAFPANIGGYENVRIYRADSETGEYTNIATVNSNELEYEDSDGDCTKYYKIAWYDGETESAKISVQSSIQQIIKIIRTEFKVLSTALSDNEIEYLINDVKRLVDLDISVRIHGEELEKLTDGIYQIPNKYYYDINAGGIVSFSDLTFYKQIIPVYAYTEKTTVDPIKIDFDECYVQVPVLNSNEILKFDYYYTGGRLQSYDLYRMIAYRICANHFQNMAANAISSQLSNPYSSVKIGPITVTNGVNSSTGTTVNAITDFAAKMMARYKDLIKNFKSGCIRVN